MSRVGWDKLLPNKRIKIGFYPLCNLLVDDEVDGASRLCRKATSRKCHRYIDVQVIKWENIVIVRRPLCGPITLQVFVNAGDPPAASEAPASSLFLLFLSRADVSKPTPCRSPKSVAVTARVYTRSV
ncbi:hypothetical protein T4D_4268 [Trichinella pseudospiralis]|uniref:Uncharacterized protein n=1 Tax=Trichinella pseudospiralis TaxID=6337 RepID=A0A0V1FSC2_TRIPS|nr:hypothetical protein T4D_4268 [Trichinella pseudospiralis]